MKSMETDIVLAAPARTPFADFGHSLRDVPLTDLAVHAERELGISRDKTNLYGGGISIGHPPRATGVRMTMTAMHHLQDSGGRYAVLTMCLGAGQGMAMLIENLLV